MTKKTSPTPSLDEVFKGEPMDEAGQRLQRDIFDLLNAAKFNQADGMAILANQLGNMIVQQQDVPPPIAFALVLRNITAAIEEAHDVIASHQDATKH